MLLFFTLPRRSTLSSKNRSVLILLELYFTEGKRKGYKIAAFGGEIIRPPLFLSAIIICIEYIKSLKIPAITFLIVRFAIHSFKISAINCPVV
jgi:hypothetical protein